MPSSDRIQILEQRVRWLDSYRRPISVVLALVLGVVVHRGLIPLLGDEWVLRTIAATPVAAVAWWLIEVALAWVIAIWETEHDRLVRERGLPQARLLGRNERRVLRRKRETRVG